MSDVIQNDKDHTCPQCGALVPAHDTNGLCPACLLSEVMQPSAGVIAPEDLAAQFPGYEILRLLGRGGMGAVYLARQMSLNRLVAIKILPADIDNGENHFIERFKNEAEAMARLNHPGIVGVHEFGQTAGGLLFIIMEYVDGTDVHLMLANQGRLHSAQAMAITAHVCDALAYAHSRGIIHRDIKPSNIMISREGQVKVADFGLAKFGQGHGSANLTQSGKAIGTPHFIAPEALAAGSAVDHRADIFALGVMLYQMLTGKLPQGLFEMPSLQVPGLDPRYDRIVAKALRDDREMRYQNAVEMRRDLDAIVTQPVNQAPGEGATVPLSAGRPYDKEPRPPVRHTRSKTLFVLELVAAAVLVAMVAFFAARKRQSASDQSKAAAQTSRPSAPKDQTERDSPHASEGANAASESSPSKASDQATLASPYVNTLGMRFVSVPGTKALFCIHETRRRDYAAYAAAMPRVAGDWQNQLEEGVPCGAEDDHPVVGVSWHDAQAFCQWLSQKEGKKYRLPTDHEWSIAAGIGDREAWTPQVTPAMLNDRLPGVFAWGDGPRPRDGQRAGNFGDETFHKRFPAKRYVENYNDGFATTAPVMRFDGNKHGIHDLAGNVSEWVEEWYDASHSKHLLRGGSWIHGLASASARFPADPDSRNGLDGFRIVLDASDREATTPQVQNRSLAPQVFLGKTFGDCEKYLGPPGQVLAPTESMRVHALVYQEPKPGIKQLRIESPQAFASSSPANRVVTAVLYDFQTHSRHTVREVFAQANLTTQGTYMTTGDDLNRESEGTDITGEEVLGEDTVTYFHGLPRGLFAFWTPASVSMRSTESFRHEGVDRLTVYQQRGPTPRERIANIKRGYDPEGMVALGRSAELLANGAFSFPQSKSKVLSDQYTARFSVWSSPEWLYVQIICWADADPENLKAPDGKERCDESHLYLDLDNDQERGPDDAHFALNPEPAMRGLYREKVINGTSNKFVPVTSGRGAIRFVNGDSRSKIRVDSFLIPLREIGKKPGDHVRIAVVGISWRPRIGFNSAQMGLPNSPQSFYRDLPGRSYQDFVLGTNRGDLDPMMVPQDATK